LVTINRNKVSAGIAIIVIVLIFPWTCPNTQAQTDITFKPADKFSIPSNNDTISFAVNGTYSKATLENDTWTFMNLRLNGSQPLENFKISAQNSNVTIFSYQAYNTTTFQIVLLRYLVEGQGEQILNLGLGSQEGGLSASIEWSVIVGNNVFLAEGEGWSISHDGSMVVTGATGNVSIVHWGFFENGVPSSNLPFYQQHSVAIVITMVVAVTVIVAIVIKVKNREHSGESELVKSA
jgi:hypothetical protein